MHLEEFSEGKSLIHRLDPRVKILFFAVFAFVAALENNLVFLVVELAAALCVLVMSHVSWKAVLKRLAVLNLFVVMMWLTIPFSVPGEAVASFGWWTVTREGLLTVFMITVKAQVIVLMTLALIGTTPVFTLAHALAHLRMPRKLVYLFFFFYRYISVLHRESDKLKMAAQARAFEARTDLRTFGVSGNLVGALLVRGLDRSERIYRALLLRGFREDFPLIRHFHMHRQDIVFACLAVGFLAGRLLWIF